MKFKLNDKVIVKSGFYEGKTCHVKNPIFGGLFYVCSSCNYDDSDFFADSFPFWQIKKAEKEK